MVDSIPNRRDASATAGLCSPCLVPRVCGAPSLIEARVSSCVN